MSDDLQDYNAYDFIKHTDVGHPQADSVQWVGVPGKDELFLYLWDTDTNRPVTSVVGFDMEGLEKLQEWITNAKLEHEQYDHDPADCHCCNQEGNNE